MVFDPDAHWQLSADTIVSSGKNSPFEGGLRVPALAWWPGRIPAARTVGEPLISLDLFPTVVAMAGSLVGLPVGVGYAALMLRGLKTWWVAAIVTPAGGAAGLRRDPGRGSSGES